MNTCEEFRQAIPQTLDADAPHVDDEISRHLQDCADCATLARDLREDSHRFTAAFGDVLATAPSPPAQRLPNLWTRRAFATAIAASALFGATRLASWIGSPSKDGSAEALRLALLPTLDSRAIDAEIRSQNSTAQLLFAHDGRFLWKKESEQRSVWTEGTIEGGDYENHWAPAVDGVVVTPIAEIASKQERDIDRAALWIARDGLRELVDDNVVQTRYRGDEIEIIPRAGASTDWTQARATIADGGLFLKSLSIQISPDQNGWLAISLLRVRLPADGAFEPRRNPAEMTPELMDALRQLGYMGY